jgi:hypothetical protein
VIIKYGRNGVQFHVFITSAEEYGSWSAFPSGKQHQVSVGSEDAQAADTTHTVINIKASAHTGTRTPVVQPIV